MAAVANDGASAGLQARIQSTPTAALRAQPEEQGELVSDMLFGELVEHVYTDGPWSFVRAPKLSIEGFILTSALTPNLRASTHFVNVPMTPAYGKPDWKSPARSMLPMGATLTAVSERGRFIELDHGLWVFTGHIAPLPMLEPDFVGIASKFLNSPYVWGGRTLSGIDCSGLIQIAAQATGRFCPRNSSEQFRFIEGTELVAPDAPLSRGDLVFFKGHAAIALDRTTLLHANARQLMVTIDSVATVTASIQQASGGQILGIRRTGS